MTPQFSDEFKIEFAKQDFQRAMDPICKHIGMRLNVANIKFNTECSASWGDGRIGSVTLSFNRLVPNGVNEILHLCLSQPDKTLEVFGGVPRISFVASVSSAPWPFSCLGLGETCLEKITPKIPKINRVVDRILASHFHAWGVK